MSLMPRVQEVLETMDYGPAPESNGDVKAWLSTHGHRFSHFIGGRFVAPSPLRPCQAPRRPCGRDSRGLG